MFAVKEYVQNIGCRRLRASAVARAIALGAGLLAAPMAHAGPDAPHAEIFTGLEANNNALSGYLGAGYAFGKGLYEPGWRVRAVGALGR
jgi:hypothetical protein